MHLPVLELDVACWYNNTRLVVLAQALGLLHRVRLHRRRQCIALAPTTACCTIGKQAGALSIQNPAGEGLSPAKL
jgi:hypothetical protein